MRKGIYSKISIDMYYKAQKGDDKIFNELFKVHSRLIDYMMAKFTFSPDIKPEMYRNALTDALCKAILTYKPNYLTYTPTSFNKYAFVCMANAANGLTQRRMLSQGKKKDVLNTDAVVSLDSIEYIDDCGDVISLVETIPDESSPKNEPTSYRLVVENLYQLLSENEKICIKGLVQGKTNSRIAAELGVSTSCITERVANMRFRMKRLIRVCNNVAKLRRQNYSFDEINKILTLPAIRDSRKYYQIYQFIYGETKRKPEISITKL